MHQLIAASAESGSDLSHLGKWRGWHALSPHRHCQFHTLLATEDGEFHLIIGPMVETNIGQELALSHRCRFAVYGDDDIADAEPCFAGPLGAFGDHVLYCRRQAVGGQTGLSFLLGGERGWHEP